MIRPLSLAQHTLYADLLDQERDDVFDPDLRENGSILLRGNCAGAPAAHAYYQGYRFTAGDAGRGQRYARYLGRADDPEVAARIARFQRVRATRAERTTTVRALIGAGMPRPDRTTGRIIEALARAALFPDHAVLIGDAAYQTYNGVLGVRLAKARTPTPGRRPAVEIVVREQDRMPRILDALQTVDPSFTASKAADTYHSTAGARVAVASLDHSADEMSGLLGFLIADPVHALVLHGPGIPVVVPAPERYAVCSLVQHEERDLSSTRHDSHAPVLALMTALSIAGRETRLGQLLKHALREPRWQAPLHKALRELPEPIRATLQADADVSV